MFHSERPEYILRTCPGMVETMECVHSTRTKSEVDEAHFKCDHTHSATILQSLKNCKLSDKNSK
jgi:hypothetical protein